MKPDKSFEDLQRENKELKLANIKLKHDLSNAITAQVSDATFHFLDEKFFLQF